MSSPMLLRLAKLQRAALIQKSSSSASSPPWLRLAGILGTAAATVVLVTESATETNSHREINTNESQDLASTNTKNFQQKKSSSPFQVPTQKISLSFPHLSPLSSMGLTNATECAGFASLFRGTTNLKRTSTIVTYKNEVSTQSVRDIYLVNWRKPLGQGGFGAVYRAVNRQTGEIVALKQISKKYTDNVGFQREMEALLHLRRAGGHPNICGLIENFDEGNYFYFSLDLISGGEMFDHLIANGPYSEEDAARLIREISSALDFMHGIGFVHGDLKPENLMLSTEHTSDAVVKVIDFGCAQVTTSKDEEPGVVGLTAAYSSPELLKLAPDDRKRIDPPLDMWALGVILHIMLVGCHPFDFTGEATDTKIANLVIANKTPATLQKDSPMVEHLSDSALDVIRRLLEWDPKKRITASEMLEHPWVQGTTARKDKISGSDKKLSKFRVFKSRLEAQVFEDIVSWADSADSEDVSKRTSLLERSFRKLDEQQKGYISAKDLKKFAGSSDASKGGDTSADDEELTLSGFSALLSESMKNKYFPSGKVLYKQGEIGNSMLFVNSGMLEVETKQGYKVVVKAGNFVGEGALVSPDKTRNATVRCLTPVHAIEVSREDFDKYLSASRSGLALHMREKDKKRALNRTQAIMRRQRDIRPMDLKKGDVVYREGEPANEMYIVEDGLIDNCHLDNVLATSKPGEMFGVGSLVTHRNRNSSAICVSDKCRIHMMKERDFFEFMDSSPMMKSSVYDVFLRKEFAKAVAHRTKKKFDEMSRKDLKEVFDALDTAGDGVLTLDELRALVLDMDKTIPEDVVVGILNSLDIDSSGDVDFAEFCQIFGSGGAS